MQLSVIIVNYNVRHFLQNCLSAALKSLEGIDGEIIVVDNASTDGSREMMSELFPEIKYLFLEENLGFSRGNNIGIAKAQGEVILLLNPDTIVQEQSFRICLEHFTSNPKVGGLGVRMIDGTGTFLPESKRGLPTPKAAFYKLSGLSSIFPQSKRFGQYHIAFLDQRQNHDVEILSGAYMMVRKSVLDKIGALDESFFMYGEDIDLSYRIVKAGYINRYCADTEIIHYKGESTKKDSVNYVFVFYRAMAIFAKKHFDKGNASLFGFVISAAIYMRAGLSLIKTVLKRVWQFLLDFLIIYGVFFLTTKWYEQYGDKDFSDPFISLALPLYSLILSTVLAYAGAQNQPFRVRRLLRGWSVAILFLLAIYALFPEGFRFSRAVVLIGSAASITVGAFWRLMVSKFGKEQRDSTDSLRRLVVGSSGSIEKAKSILATCKMESAFIAGIGLETGKFKNYIGGLDNLGTAVQEFRIDEVILDSNVCTYSTIVKVIEDSAKSKAGCLVMTDNWMLGPNTLVKPHKYPQGNQLNTIQYSDLWRLKRTFDIIFSCVVLISAPALVWFVDHKIGLITNALSILFGQKSWVGYDQRGEHESLPLLRPGVIHPNMHMIWAEGDAESAFNGNVNYVDSNTFITDFQLVILHLENLGD